MGIQSSVVQSYSQLPHPPFPWRGTSSQVHLLALIMSMVNINFPARYQSKVNEDSPLGLFIRKILRELLNSLLGKALKNLACNLRCIYFSKIMCTHIVNIVTCSITFIFHHASWWCHKEWCLVLNTIWFILYYAQISHSIFLISQKINKKADLGADTRFWTRACPNHLTFTRRSAVEMYWYGTRS